MARVQVLRSTPTEKTDDWQLRLQWCRYVYDDGGLQEGYRFIWMRPEGSLQAARGQARIPSLTVARALMAQADREGWGGHQGD